MHPDQCTLTNALTRATLSSLPNGATGAACPSTFMASGGTFDFTVQLNDTLTPRRTREWSFSITIN
jgi:hypothetical protein